MVSRGLREPEPEDPFDDDVNNSLSYMMEDDDQYSIEVNDTEIIVGRRGCRYSVPRYVARMASLYPENQHRWVEWMDPTRERRAFGAVTWAHGTIHSKISKFFAYCLRHSPAVARHVDPDGYVDLDVLMALYCVKEHRQHSQPRIECLCDVIGKNLKQRYSARWLNDEHTLIGVRANAGHSRFLAPNLQTIGQALTLSTMPSLCVHGTTMSAAMSILSDDAGMNGLRPGGFQDHPRAHVHFATLLPASGLRNLSGLKSRSKVIFSLDLRLWLTEGHRAVITDNNIVLVEEVIPKRYLKAAIDVANLKDIFSLGSIGQIQNTKFWLIF